MRVSVSVSAIVVSIYYVEVKWMLLLFISTAAVVSTYFDIGDRVDKMWNMWMCKYRYIARLGDR